MKKRKKNCIWHNMRRNFMLKDELEHIVEGKPASGIKINKVLENIKEEIKINHRKTIK